MKLKVMTWNVENFFPTGVGAGPQTPAEYDAKLETLSSVISKQDPDVLALQEVGDVNHTVPRSLTDLVAKLGTSSYSFEVSKHPDPRGIRVAILVRKTLDATFPAEIVKLPTEAPLPIHDIEGHTPKEMGRGAVRARLQIAGKTIHVVTAHLKSKLLEFPGGAFSTTDEGLRLRVADAALIRRAAEAAAIRQAVTQLLVDDPNDGVVVMGDLNDEALAATTEILYGPPGSQPGTGGFDPADAGDAQRLFNVTGFIPDERRYSRISEGKKELIDHILVSLALVPQLDDKHKRHPDEVDSLIDYGAGGADGGLPSIPESPAPRQGKPASDHSPLVATFEI
jgi:endonuclease/exonuclease/phosphatase family metal-dependent hydrolase